jgi:DNA-binding NtrC family response regulator
MIGRNMRTEPTVLVADDEADIRLALRQAFERHQFHVLEADNGQSAIDICSRQKVDFILLDVRMPIKTGLDALAEIKNNSPKALIVFVTAHANIQDAVQAMQNGAFDYIEKPLKADKLEELINKVLHAKNLRRQARLSFPQNSSPVENFVGESKPMLKVFELINKLAEVDTSVLIRGENGTGKELVARAIHAISSRKSREFVSINCGAISEAFLESELFGHEKGAFAGAEQRKIGKFQFASGGTLFLDEVTELSLSAQAKLLHALQEKRVNPVGATREINVDTRVIAASNRPIEDLIKEGKFREDLFYGLNVMPVFLPPLRDRVEDIPFLTDHFVQKFNSKQNKEIKGIEDSALKELKTYPWPGNIRELENAVEHAFILSNSDMLELKKFPEHIHESLQDQGEGWTPKISGSEFLKAGTSNFKAAKEDFEKTFIVQALKDNNGKINQTCEKANIPKNTLLRKIQKFGITPSEFAKKS